MHLSSLRPMQDAPRDCDVLIYNPVTDWYQTRFEDGGHGKQWPLRNWNGMPGVWYPAPYGWVPVQEDRKA